MAALPEPMPVLPVYPYCGNDPGAIATATLKLGAADAVALFCANLNCRKLFGVQILHIEQPRIASPAEGFRVMRG